MKEVKLTASPESSKTQFSKVISAVEPPSRLFSSNRSADLVKPLKASETFRTLVSKNVRLKWRIPTEASPPPSNESPTYRHSESPRSSTIGFSPPPPSHTSTVSRPWPRIEVPVRRSPSDDRQRSVSVTR